jgi:DNA-3-methyladenine glycosylase II
MMMALHRCDCFPTGDIALIKSIKEVKGLTPLTSKEEILLIADTWRPYRTIAAFILWHAYIKKRNLKF